ncbi:MAG: glycosyltransferase family 4 protein [Candidatus Bathyarchaeia archaeon]
MYSGGGERTAIYECILLGRRGHEVSCFAPAVRPDVCYPELIGKINLRGFIPRVKINLPLRDFLSLSASSFLAPAVSGKFKGFDAILCHGQPATWIGYQVSMRLGKKYFCYLHQPARFLYPREIDRKVGWKTKRDLAILDHLVRLGKPFATAFDHISVVSSEKVLVNSEWIGSQVRKIYGVNVIVCPPGVDVEKFSPAEKRPMLIVNGLRIDSPFILTTNRHYPQKGLEYAIEMMPLLLKDYDVNLVITGDFTYYTSKLMKLAKDLKVNEKVIFTNRVDEGSLIELYRSASVYAYTSPCEDFGLGPLEAMACGTPAVVWDYAGPSETVLDGVTGYKARPYQIDDFVEKIARLLSDPDLNQRMAESGARYVRERYSWDNHINMLEAVIAKPEEF